LVAAVLLTAAVAGSDGGLAPGEHDRLEWLGRGEAALARGDVTQALSVFERAAGMRHAADSEMGLVRAYMQSGAYRRALAFAAHTAAAHRDVPAGAVLYAWLLHVGGQTALAQRALDTADARAPGDTLVAQARAQLRSPTPVAEGALLDAPWRVAPHDAGAPLPPSAAVAGSGILVDAGRRALASLAGPGAARALWVRDGLGRRRAAELERYVESLGLSLLRLEAPMDDAAALGLAPRDPFPGSPAFAMDFIVKSGIAPAWPVLRVGFVGTSAHDTGALFDLHGRLVGIGVPDADGRPRFVHVSALRREFGEVLGVVADQSAQRLAADAMYESALPLALQVIADR